MQVADFQSVFLDSALTNQSAANSRFQEGSLHWTADNPAPGIPLDLAIARVETVQDLRYELSFEIPRTIEDPIRGRETIRFKLSRLSDPVILDFAAGADSLISVSTNGKSSRYRTTNGHLVIPADELSAGENLLEISFRAGDAALNRNAEFLYTLFVPARAHLAVPCFDQPDLKARYNLELTIPSEWESVANGGEISRDSSRGQTRVRFGETEPIPTYLFAFAAGSFHIEAAERNGRTFRMFHREPDAAKLARNRDAIFDLHAASLEWLEKYTALPYPFGKFDFVLIPSFQFSGMEHPGAILYNASAILLEESATENQMLNRAALIAHETAHMWFGDLVTMRWFDDVWLKEVFANFLAAKMVNPLFPKLNHDLRFLISHYPGAYSVDRTAGTHPIRQELENLNEAGSLYGEIIYQKAPIVMRQLELILGEEGLQQGLRAYVMKYRFANAAWPDLVRVVDERADVDLSAWSRAWVEGAGRPSIRTEIEWDTRGHAKRIAFIQSDPQEGRSLRWMQRMIVLVGTADEIHDLPLDIHDDRAELSGVDVLPRIDFVLPNGGGLAYGNFVLDDNSRLFLLEHLHELKDPLARGAAWITLWEELLDGRVQPADFLNLVLSGLPREDTEQNVELVLGFVRSAFWLFVATPVRSTFAHRLEEMLRAALGRAGSSTLKATYFSAFRALVTTPGGIAFLQRVWRRQESIGGLNLAEQDEAAMALELAVRSVPEIRAILEEQRGRFRNPDARARFEFVMPAVSEKQATRDQFFESLKDVSNRAHEPWVIEGLRLLNHPLRSPESERYIVGALELLPEIQRTGDIFFPGNWADALLGGHNTRSAAEKVRGFLSNRKDFPIRLRRIILQSADDLFRAAAR